MDHAACHVVYLDKRAYRERFEQSDGPENPGPSTFVPESSGTFDLECKDVQLNLRAVLLVFNGGEC